MNESSDTARYLESVPLSAPPDEIEGLSEDELPKLPEYESGVDQVVVIGSQISEFAKSVPKALRPHIDNAFLLAQLAANFEINEHGGGTARWYDKYVEVLENAGWVTESRGDTLRKISGASLKVHKEIIPVLTAALGTAAAAAPLVIKVIEGLEAMNADQPWITLFDRETQRAMANQFQVSYVEVDAEQVPRLSLASFELDASRSVTQVLFFKFSEASATLAHFEAKLSVNQSVFESGKHIIAERVASRTAGFLTGVPI